MCVCERARENLFVPIVFRELSLAYELRKHSALCMSCLLLHVWNVCQEEAAECAMYLPSGYKVTEMLHIFIFCFDSIQDVCTVGTVGRGSGGGGSRVRRSNIYVCSQAPHVVIPCNPVSLDIS